MVETADHSAKTGSSLMAVIFRMGLFFLKQILSLVGESLFCLACARSWVQSLIPHPHTDPEFNDLQCSL